VQLWAETPLAGRALLIDIDGPLRDRGTPLDHASGPALGPGLLDAALAAQHCRVEPGDLVLVHTGWAHWYLTALAADSRSTGRWSSLLTVKPLHLTGGVGSPANATALR